MLRPQHLAGRCHRGHICVRSSGAKLSRREASCRNRRWEGRRDGCGRVSVSVVGARRNVNLVDVGAGPIRSATHG